MNLLTPWTPIIWLALVALVLQAGGRRLAPWARTVVRAAGVAGAGAFAVALRLSPDSAPVGFPWPASLGHGPALVADPEMFPFAALTVLILAGAVAADAAAWARWPRALALAAASLLSIYAENLLALAGAWLALEMLLATQEAGVGADADDTRTATVSAFWGMVGWVAIAWLWRETRGASLRPYETPQWTAAARAILMAVALIRMGAFPLASRRLAHGLSGLSPADAAGLAPTVAGLALAQRAAALGAPPHPGAALWLGAVGAVACGLAAWLDANPRHRAAWALGTPLGLGVMMWAEGVAPAHLVFGATAAALALGFGLWTVRQPFAAVPAPRWRHALAAGVALAPIAVACMGPLSPATASTLGLWQALLNHSRLVALALALAGQMLAMAALLYPGVAPASARDRTRAAIFAIWGITALALALWPRGLSLLAGDTSAVGVTPLSPGAWAALLLPLLGAMALPQLQEIEDTWRGYAPRALRILNLAWLRRALLGVVGAAGVAVRGVEALLHGEAYVLWAAVLLLGLMLTLGFL